MMRFIEGLLKAWNGPSEEDISRSAGIVSAFFHGTTTDVIKRNGYPYHIEYATHPVRDDN